MMGSVKFIGGFSCNDKRPLTQASHLTIVDYLKMIVYYFKVFLQW